MSGEAEQKPEAGEEPKVVINKLPKGCGYKLVNPKEKPIPVDVSYDKGVEAYVAFVGASAEDLSMLVVFGQGETEEAAKDQFAELVVESFKDMESRKNEFEGPDKTIYEALCGYIQPGEPEPEAEAPAEEPSKLPGATYIESIPKDCGYELIKPIPVEVKPDEDGDGFIAEAPDLKLLEKGRGQKPWGAIDYLTKCILDQCDRNAKDKAADRELIGLAKLVDEKLAEYLRPVEQKPDAEKPAE